jgi:hypothetical protein
MKPLIAVLEKSKTTPGTHVYMEDPSKARADKVFPTIYMQQHALPSTPPRYVRVTVEACDKDGNPLAED